MKLNKEQTTTLLNNKWLEIEIDGNTFVILMNKDNTTKFVCAGHSPYFTLTMELDLESCFEYHKSHLSTILADLRHEIELGGINTQNEIKSALKLLNEIMGKLQ